MGEIFELLQRVLNRLTVPMPRGYPFTLKKDELQRKSVELLNEFYELKR